jgi:Gpi18-like mannosyltransferase
MFVKLTLVFALGIPFLLPEMHERYFYLADVISVVYAFYAPRHFYVPILVQLCSLLSYAPYLLNTQIVNLAYVAVIIFLLTLVVTADLVVALYPDQFKRLPVTPEQDEDAVNVVSRA